MDAPAPVALVRYRIGCAGWSVRSDWRTASAQGASRLAHYAVGLNATEINSSFHRPHRAAVYARWAAEVPEDFRFSVKMPKTISHGARLQQCAGLLDAFMDQVEGLAGKLGCVLLQTPREDGTVQFRRRRREDGRQKTDEEGPEDGRTRRRDSPVSTTSRRDSPVLLCRRRDQKTG